MRKDTPGRYGTKRVGTVRDEVKRGLTPQQQDKASSKVLTQVCSVTFCVVVSCDVKQL